MAPEECPQIGDFGVETRMHFEGMNLLARSSNIAFTLLRDKPIMILHSIQIKMILGTRNGDLLQATTLARGLRHDAGERKRERQKVLHLHAHTNSPNQSRFRPGRLHRAILLAKACFLSSKRRNFNALHSQNNHPLFV